MGQRRLLAVLAVALFGMAMGRPALAQAPAAPASAALRPASAFAEIADPKARSIAVIEEAGKVLLHPRCVNCHPATARPLQTDRMRPHQPLVVRGEDRKGAPGGMRCDTCHGAANFDPARIPGAEHWHLAPASMAWQGRSIGQICEQLKKPELSDGLKVADMPHHVRTDGRVIWAWTPGPGRTPAPGTHQMFVGLIEEWVATGAHCPAR